jgi:NAD(P)H dehydrogenase (quinone)
MNYLVIYAHPNPKSFNAAIKEQLVALLKSRGREVVVRDLYELGFNPVLSGNDFTQFLQGQTPPDIAQEQELVRKAEVLIFVYPVWWVSMPAILKGYIDRVLSRGFAYNIDSHGVKGLLTGKKVMIFNTTGGPRIAYFFMNSLAGMKISIDAGIFKFCGMKVLIHKYFFAVPTVTDQVRKKMLADIKKLDV